MDKAALYLRLSKEDVDKICKGDDSESIINQRLLLTDYAITHDFQISDIYSDDDYSGLYDDRPEFDRLIRDSKLGKFNVVIAKTQSRFTRNMEHVEKYLHHDFPLLGIRFIGVVDGVDTQNTANKKSRQINGLVNEWYCEDLSNNIKAVFHQKMKAGQFLGGYAPYGYLKDPNDKYKFIIDEDAAEVVKKIYSLFLQGYSLKGICHYLEDEKIPNPTVHKYNQGLTYKNAKANEFSVKYGLWSITTVKRILSNETYIGTLIQGMVKKASYKDKKIVQVPKEEWYIVENHHEPIIDEKTFYKVEKIRTQRRITLSNQGEEHKVHIFAGKVRCADCGHSMIKTGGGYKGDWYFRCQLANKSRLKDCTTHGIKYSTLYDLVFTRIKDIVNIVTSNRCYKQELEQIVSNAISKSSIPNIKSKIMKLERNIDEIAKSVSALYIDRVRGNISDDMFLQLKIQFEKELQDLEKKKSEMEKELHSMEQSEKSKNDIYDIVKSHTDYTELTYELVNDFIDYIEIGEKNKETKEQDITIHWNF